MIARVIALGQRTAGDDGVGPAVLERLRAVAPPDVELIELAEPSAVIPLVAGAVPLVIVDAVVMDGRSPGELIELAADALPPRTRRCRPTASICRRRSRSARRSRAPAPSRRRGWSAS